MENLKHSIFIKLMKKITLKKVKEPIHKIF